MSELRADCSKYSQGKVSRDKPLQPSREESMTTGKVGFITAKHEDTKTIAEFCSSVCTSEI